MADWAGDRRPGAGRRHHAAPASRRDADHRLRRPGGDGADSIWRRSSSPGSTRHLGQPTVERLRFVQQARRRPPPRPAAPPPRRTARCRPPVEAGRRPLPARRVARGAGKAGAGASIGIAPDRPQAGRSRIARPPNGGRMRLPRRTLLAAVPALPPPRPLRPARGPGPPDRSAPGRARHRQAGCAGHGDRVLLPDLHPLRRLPPGNLPAGEAELVDTGRIRLVWRDFPLDQLALTAAAVARSPAAGALRGLHRRAVRQPGPLGLRPRATRRRSWPRWRRWPACRRPQFDQVVADEALKRAILEQRTVAEQEFNVQATPSFVLPGAAVEPIRHTFDRSGAVQDASRLDEQPSLPSAKPGRTAGQPRT